jgi:hypothetical protein
MKAKTVGKTICILIVLYSIVKILQLLFLNNCNPKYNPEKFNNDINIRKSHNCYMYALNKIDNKLAKKWQTNCSDLNKCIRLKHRPGNVNGYISKPEVSTCENIRKGVLEDNPSIYLSNQHDICKNGYYKIASSVNENKSFHFYRQDKNNLWSHKDGGTRATNLDKSQNEILDPKYCNRGSYKTFCNYFCVPNGKLYKTRSNPYFFA